MNTHFPRRLLPLLLGVPLFAACGGTSGTSNQPAQAPATHPVQGSITVAGVSTTCDDLGGFSDVGPGTGVTVKDQAGTTIGAATMGTATRGDYGASCVEKFSLTLPDNATFYAVSMGHRTPVTYSHDEMVSKNWTIELTLS